MWGGRWCSRRVVAPGVLADGGVPPLQPLDSGWVVKVLCTNPGSLASSAAGGPTALGGCVAAGRCPAGPAPRCEVPAASVCSRPRCSLTLHAAPGPHGTSVHRGDSSPYHLTPPYPTPPAVETVLETWVFHYQPTIMPQAPGLSRSQLSRMNPTSIYKRLIILLRSLFCYVRMLPAYRMFRVCKVGRLRLCGLGRAG